MGLKVAFKVLLLISLFLSACVQKPSEDYLKKQRSVDEFKVLADEFCYLDKQLSSQEDWLIATVYFNDKTATAVSLGDANKVFEQISALYKNCITNLLIIGNTSNKEKSSSSLDISLNRTLFVKNNLEKRQIDPNYLKVVFCDNYLNAYQENNAKSSRYNQRVDIIFLHKMSDLHPCIVNMS